MTTSHDKSCSNLPAILMEMIGDEAYKQPSDIKGLQQLVADSMQYRLGMENAYPASGVIYRRPNEAEEFLPLVLQLHFMISVGRGLFFGSGSFSPCVGDGDAIGTSGEPFLVREYESR